MALDEGYQITKVMIFQPAGNMKAGAKTCMTLDEKLVDYQNH